MITHFKASKIGAIGAEIVRAQVYLVIDLEDLRQISYTFCCASVPVWFIFLFIMCCFVVYRLVRYRYVAYQNIPNTPNCTTNIKVRASSPPPHKIPNPKNETGIVNIHITITRMDVNSFSINVLDVMASNDIIPSPT
jgi:hypothetical protein